MQANRTEMDKGAQAADRFWDRNLDWLTVGWFAGFTCRLFALYAAQHNPAVALVTFNSIHKAVQDLTQSQQTEN